MSATASQKRKEKKYFPGKPWLNMDANEAQSFLTRFTSSVPQGKWATEKNDMPDNLQPLQVYGAVMRLKEYIAPNQPGDRPCFPGGAKDPIATKELLDGLLALLQNHISFDDWFIVERLIPGENGVGLFEVEFEVGTKTRLMMPECTRMRTLELIGALVKAKPQFIEYFADNKGFEVLMRFLTTSKMTFSTSLKMCVIDVMGCAADESERAIAEVVRLNAIQVYTAIGSDENAHALLKQIAMSNLSIITSNISKVKKKVKSELTPKKVNNSIESLIEIVRSSTEKLLQGAPGTKALINSRSDAAEALSELMLSVGNKDLFLKYKGPEAVVAMLKQQSTKFNTKHCDLNGLQSCISVCARVARGDAIFQEKLANIPELLETFVDVLKWANVLIKTHACSALTNMTGRISLAKRKVINHGAVPLLFKFMSEESSVSKRTEYLLKYNGGMKRMDGCMLPAYLACSVLNNIGIEYPECLWPEAKKYLPVLAELLWDKFSPYAHFLELSPVLSLTSILARFNPSNQATQPMPYSEWFHKVLLIRSQAEIPLVSALESVLGMMGVTYEKTQLSPDQKGYLGPLILAIAQQCKEIHQTFPPSEDRDYKFLSYKLQFFGLQQFEANNLKFPSGVTDPKSICGKKGCPNTIGLKACSACKSVYYCGRSCQAVDWATHKLECKRLQQSKK